MSWKSIVLGTVIASLGLVAPLAAGPVTNKQRNACEIKADNVVPALRMPEREAFIANCLADATASSASSKSNKGQK
jgi:hypothetical protein